MIQTPTIIKSILVMLIVLGAGILFWKALVGIPTTPIQKTEEALLSPQTIEEKKEVPTSTPSTTASTTEIESTTGTDINMEYPIPD